MYLVNLGELENSKHLNKINDLLLNNNNNNKVEKHYPKSMTIYSISLVFRDSARWLEHSSNSAIHDLPYGSYVLCREDR